MSHLYICGYFLHIWKGKIKDHKFHFKARCFMCVYNIVFGTGGKRMMRKASSMTENRSQYTDGKKFTKRPFHFTVMRVTIEEAECSPQTT